MPASPSEPKQSVRECRFRIGKETHPVKYVCTVHHRDRVSLHMPLEHALQLSLGMGDAALQVACRVELERRGESGWWNMPEGTAVYEKTRISRKISETRNCYLAMWLPQLLIRDFIRHEAEILGE